MHEFSPVSWNWNYTILLYTHSRVPQPGHVPSCPFPLLSQPQIRFFPPFLTPSLALGKTFQVFPPPVVLPVGGHGEGSSLVDLKRSPRFLPQGIDQPLPFRTPKMWSGSPGHSPPPLMITFVFLVSLFDLFLMSPREIERSFLKMCFIISGVALFGWFPLFLFLKMFLGDKVPPPPNTLSGD